MKKFNQRSPAKFEYSTNLEIKNMDIYFLQENNDIKMQSIVYNNMHQGDYDWLDALTNRGHFCLMFSNDDDQAPSV